MAIGATFEHMLARLNIVSGLALLMICASCGGRRVPQTTHRPHRRSVEPYQDGIAKSARASTNRRKGNWSLTSEKVRDVASIVSEASQEYGLPEDLIYGIIWVESRFDPRAVSPVGARGLMQLMPRTADYLAECIQWQRRADSFDPMFNIMAGTYYIARLIKSFDGDEDLALAAYNAGPAKVRRWLNQNGLPKVSIEYSTMVQTARGFFGDAKGSKEDEPNRSPHHSPVITDEALDRLGLAILIAGLDTHPVGMDREDDATPFN